MFSYGKAELAMQIHTFLSRVGVINFGVYQRAPMAPLSPNRRRRRIVIIGGGVAGLSAARQMDSFGFDVIVLEGRNRVGGRVTTYEHGRYKADLGAMVITGLGGKFHSRARQNGRAWASRGVGGQESLRRGQAGKRVCEVIAPTRCMGPADHGACAQARCAEPDRSYLIAVADPLPLFLISGHRRQSTVHGL